MGTFEETTQRYRDAGVSELVHALDQVAVRSDLPDDVCALCIVVADRLQELLRTR